MGERGERMIGALVLPAVDGPGGTDTMVVYEDPKRPAGTRLRLEYFPGRDKLAWPLPKFHEAACFFVDVMRKEVGDA